MKSRGDCFGSPKFRYPGKIGIAEHNGLAISAIIGTSHLDAIFKLEFPPTMHAGFDGFRILIFSLHILIMCIDLLPVKGQRT